MKTKREILSTNLKRLMERSYLQQQQVADMCSVSKASFNDWIQGRTYPRPDKLALLANALNVNEYDLTTDIENGSQRNIVNREVASIAEDIYTDPEARAIYQAFCELSPENKMAIKQIVFALKNKK